MSTCHDSGSGDLPVRLQRTRHRAEGVRHAATRDVATTVALMTLLARRAAGLGRQRVRRGVADLDRLATRGDPRRAGAVCVLHRPGRSSIGPLTHDGGDVNTARLVLTRDQILSHRRRVTALDERLPPGARLAPPSGLARSHRQHAAGGAHLDPCSRDGTDPSDVGAPPLVQVWGPRFSAYVIAARDRAVFTLGAFHSGRRRRRAERSADRSRHSSRVVLSSYAEAGREMGSSRTCCATPQRPAAS